MVCTYTHTHTHTPTQYHEVTLDCAGNILMPDTYDPVSGQVTQAPTNSKSEI